MNQIIASLGNLGEMYLHINTHYIKVKKQRERNRQRQTETDRDRQYFNTHVCGLTGSPRILMTANPSNEVIEGTGVTLTCVAHGHPRPGVWWRKDGGFLPGGILQADTPIVRLNPARIPDRGEYICKASNGVAPDAVNSIYLKVDGKMGWG